MTENLGKTALAGTYYKISTVASTRNWYTRTQISALTDTDSVSWCFHQTFITVSRSELNWYRDTGVGCAVLRCTGVQAWAGQLPGVLLLVVSEHADHLGAAVLGETLQTVVLSHQIVASHH